MAVIKYSPATSNEELKVAQLAGYISAITQYHHGETSLENSIKGKAFLAPGGKQLPYLVPSGNFGTRLDGGADAASSRYIYCKFNTAMNLIFPPIDNVLLEYNFDEGKRSEPKYFVPIIPMATVESTELPAHGWKLKTWARDVFDVIKNVRRMIIMCPDAATGKILDLPRMKPYTGKWTGQIRTVRGMPTSFGIYSICANDMILISELPLRVWTKVYMKKLYKKAEKNPHLISSVEFTPYDDRVDIKVYLCKHALSTISGYADGYFTDGIEEFFELRTHMDSQLNMLGVLDEVFTFNTYEEILIYWFDFRKKLYATRIERQRILLSAHIIYYTNIVMYIATQMNVANRTEVNQVEMLTDAKYTKIAHTMLSPEFASNDELNELIFGKSASYDYLLNLSDRTKSIESLVKYKEKLALYQEELDQLNVRATLGKFLGAMIWLDELDELEKTLIEGFATDWKYKDHGKFTF